MMLRGINSVALSQIYIRVLVFRNLIQNYSGYERPDKTSDRISPISICQHLFMSHGIECMKRRLNKNLSKSLSFSLRWRCAGKHTITQLNETTEMHIRESSFSGENEKLRATRCVLIASGTITVNLPHAPDTKHDETHSAYHNSGITLSLIAKTKKPRFLFLYQYYLCRFFSQMLILHKQSRFSIEPEYSLSPDPVFGRANRTLD